MKNIISKSWIAFFVLFAFILFSGCKDNGKNRESSSVSGLQAPGVADTVNTERAETSDIAVSVDGKILKKSELESNLKEKLKIMKDKIPADKQKEFADKQKEIQENIRKQMVNGFIVKTLLSNEFAKRKIEVSSEDVKKAMDIIAASISPNKKIDDFLKENKISQEDIIFSIKVYKFSNMEIGEKAKPTKKEISKFYNENRDKFTEPERVHVRHILVAVGKDDSDKVKAQKKEKIEDLRKQLLKGGNFAELASKNSDCPSKEVGGDLSFIKKGEMAKPFENAAFSQEKNAIGPVIKTEFGYHIIQVLEHKPAKKVSWDQAKNKISPYLERQKKSQAFIAILKNLQEKANIIIY
jgi:peptidyl-prolyl cis-trans isomerase C